MKLSTCIVLCLLLALDGYSQNAQSDTWLPEARVRSLARGEGKVFLSGDFRWIGEDYGQYAAVFNPDLSLDATYAPIERRARNAIPDDAGGWYINDGGSVSHVKADKSIELLPFEVTSGSAIYAIRKSGNILYLGGQFGAINGITRANLAAIDLTDNSVTSWNPGTVGTVYSMEVAGSLLYIGGSFTTVGGITRRKMAAIDVTTGVPTSWNVNTSSSFGYVLDIIVTPGAVYFGGSFNIFAPSIRSNFAAVNTTTGAPIAFDPQPNDVVHDLLLDGATLYIAGEFSQMGVVSKYGLAAFDTGTGAMTPFGSMFPETYDGPVTTMAILGSSLYVGGDFTQINGVDKAKLAVLDKTTGALVSTVSRNVSDEPYTICIVGSKVLVGWYNVLGIHGEYNTAQCAALDETTGIGFGWTPQIPGLPAGTYPSDSKLHYQDNRLYYWQDLYHSPTSTSSTRLGALDADDGSSVPSFTVSVTGVVTAWAFSSDVMFLAGEFTAVNGVTRSGFAAVDLANGSVLPLVIPYTPNYAGGEEIRSIAIENDVLYAAGNFSFADGGVTRNRLAAWNATTGALQPWAPQLTLPYPTAIPEIGAIHNGKAYLIGGVVARVNLATGIADSWQPSNGTEIIDGANSIAVQGNYVYLVGGFSPGVVRVGMVSGNPTAWQPNIEDVYDSEGNVYTVAASESKLYVGGNYFFDHADGSHGQYFAQFDIPADVGNDPPVIATTTSGLPVAGVVSIDLTQLISDPDDNLDLGTLQLLDPITEQGAEASIDASHTLTLTYETPFGGTDKVSIEVCDMLEACTQQEVNVEITGVDLSVFNAVSPNGDGKNDLFTLLNISPDNKVTIFNRWGVAVFTIDNYDNQTRVFRGLTDDGNELPDGTYYYRIDFSSGESPKTGFLSLRR